MSIARSLAYGLVNLLHPRMLWLMVWPMLVALIAWGAVALVFWVRSAAWLAGIFAGWVDTTAFLARLDAGNLTLIAANVVLILLFVPLVYLTALFILGVFGMPAMVEHVSRRSFPALERRHGGGTAGSAWNAVVAFLGMAGIAIVTLPLWLVPPLWPLVPVTILGWGNQRLLRYDALAEHADAAEMRVIFRKRRGALYLLGLVLALLAYVPLVGFIAPVWFGLAFIHYLLGAVEIERGYVDHGNNELARGNTVS